MRRKGWWICGRKWRHNFYSLLKHLFLYKNIQRTYRDVGYQHPVIVELLLQNEQKINTMQPAYKQCNTLIIFCHIVFHFMIILPRLQLYLRTAISSAISLFETQIVIFTNYLIHPKACDLFFSKSPDSFKSSNLLILNHQKYKYLVYTINCIKKSLTSPNPPKHVK